MAKFVDLWKPSSMKKIFLFACLAISVAAAAQETSLVEEYLNNQVRPKQDGAGEYPVGVTVHKDCFSMNKKSPFKTIIPADWDSIGTSLGLENVVRLPQDGMPCIRPDMKQFNMPNAGAAIVIKRSGPGAIPNPSTSLRVVIPKGRTSIKTKP